MADHPGPADYDELFAGPVESFVERRDALVKRLKVAGDKGEAARVKAWRRPSRVVGALNRAALADAGPVDAFVSAAQALGLAQAGGSELREATAALRAATRDLTVATLTGLDPVRPGDSAEVGSALLVLAADDDAMADLAEGRLLDLPDASAGGFGFGVPMAGSPAPAPRPAKAAEKASGEDELAARRAEVERARREAAVAKARDVLASAERRATAAAAAQATAEAERDQLAERLDAAEATLRAAEDEAATASARVDEAAAALADLDGT